jgi:hypothetical protein
MLVLEVRDENLEIPGTLNYRRRFIVVIFNIKILVLLDMDLGTIHKVENSRVQ